MGNVEMEDVFNAFEKTEEIAEKVNAFEIEINEIEYFLIIILG